MSRCQHPSARLIYEGIYPASASSHFRTKAHPAPKMQVFHCPHCDALQPHIIHETCVEVRPWTHQELSDRFLHAHLLLTTRPPPPRNPTETIPAPAVILPFLTAHHPDRRGRQFTASG